jgi:hypothetical protein
MLDTSKHMGRTDEFSTCQPILQLRLCSSFISSILTVRSVAVFDSVYLNSSFSVLFQGSRCKAHNSKVSEFRVPDDFQVGTMYFLFTMYC